jgi:histidinol-phosphatase (PHP family)
MIGDYHVHTNFSSDCTSAPEELVEKALLLGMNEICFTDHVDFDYPLVNGEKLFNIDVKKYFDELTAVKDKYRGRIKIKIGVELGLNPSTNSMNKEFVHSADFDFIIGSSHIVNGIDPYYAEYWEGKTTKDAIMEYYEAILKNVTICEDYDVYGHLDYIRRYVRDKEYVYTDSDFYEITDMIFKNIISKGHGIELNTRGITDGITNFIPTITLLKRYHDLGGEIITLGSDSHKVKNVGYAFKTAKDILINTGFKYITTFENRTPSFISIL